MSSGPPIDHTLSVLGDELTAEYVNDNAIVTRLNENPEDTLSLNKWITMYAAAGPEETTWRIQFPQLPKRYGAYGSLAQALIEIEGTSFTLQCQNHGKLARRWTPTSNATKCSRFLHLYNRVFSQMHVPAVESRANRHFLDIRSRAEVSYVLGGVRVPLGTLSDWFNVQIAHSHRTVPFEPIKPVNTCIITFGKMPEGTFTPLAGKTFKLHGTLGAVSNWTCSAVRPIDVHSNHLCAEYICKYVNTLGGTAISGSNEVTIHMVHGGGAAAP